MSDHIIKIIPADPDFCCDEETAEHVAASVRRHIGSEFQGSPLSIAYSLREYPVFVDCGSGLEPSAATWYIRTKAAGGA